MISKKTIKIIIAAFFLIILIFIIIYFSIIHQVHSVESIKAEDDPSRQISAYVIIENLSVRENPTQKAKEITRLKENACIKIFEFSKNKDTIKIRGRNITSCWYKTNLNKTGSGWVFGGGISFSKAVPRDLQKRLMRNFLGHMLLLDNGKTTFIKNHNFGMDSYTFNDYLFFHFKKYERGIYSYVFTSDYPLLGDCVTYLLFVHAKTGKMHSINNGYIVSPDKKHILTAYYDEPGATNTVKLYYISKESFQLMYSDEVSIYPHTDEQRHNIKFFHPIEKVKWINNKKVELQFKDKRKYFWDISKKLL